MSKMIPAYIQDSTLSTGEKRIFERLKNERNSDDWLVFHSLPLMKHPKNLEGEIDFLVVVPNCGIFCLEIKAGAVRRDNNRYWIYTNKYNIETKTTKNPFEQARNEKFSILNWIKNTIPFECYSSTILVESIVVFPDIPNFNVYSTEWDFWQVCDRDKLNYFSFHDIFDEAASCLVKKFKTINPNRNCFLHGPDIKVSSMFEQLLLPVFEYASIPYFKEERLRLTQEQYNTVTSVIDNDRILINGLAGTGKTVICIKLAHYFQEQGKKVLFLCFNKLLSNYLEESVKDIEIEFVGNIDKFLYHQVKNKNLLPKEINAKYFGELPQIVADLVSNENEKFDVIIADEAQDIINLKYMKVLNSFLRGGFDNGKWVLAGDFYSQNIYGHTFDNPIALLQDFSLASFVRFNLKKNCRNTINICEKLKEICEINYRDINLLPKGNIVFYGFYDNLIQEVTNIIKWEESLREKYSNENPIVILTYDNKHLKEVVEQYSKFGIILQEYKRDLQINICISTVHKIKGLEFINVCLTGINSEETLKNNLSYIGMSRANENLLLNMTKNLANFFV